MTSIYAATKAALTSISEVLYAQRAMAGTRLHAGLLYPGPHIVDAGIFRAARNRAADMPHDRTPVTPPSLDDMRELHEAAGTEWAVTRPVEVSGYLLEAIYADRFRILPESEATDASVRARLECILERRDPALG